MKQIRLADFHGFYESIHCLNLDGEFESFFQNETGEIPENLDLPDFSYTSELLSGYSKLYVEALAKELELPLLFDSLYIPKEYNFRTDKITIQCSDLTVLRIFLNTNKETLQQVIKQRHTSHSGFISFYSNDLSEWPENVLEWDEVQLGTLLKAYMADNSNFDDFCSMEDAHSNGYLSNLVFESLPQKTQDLINSL